MTEPAAGHTQGASRRDRRRPGRRLIIAASMLAVAWAVVAPALGPSDLWEDSQPRTVSYTTDIIVHGRWILPVERGEFPATKPPLYNWLAVPGVRRLGFTSEIAHKLPSVVALLVSWLLIVRVGRTIGRGLAADGEAGDGDVVGWAAGLAFVGSFTVFKIGSLARPDMLLTLWVLLGWIAATAIAAASVPGPDGVPGGRAPRGTAAGLWLCVGLAGLTKGPAAFVLVAYALLVSFLLGGRTGLRRLGWWWGLPLGLGMTAAWGAAVWRIDPVHLREQLWLNEIYGRITGLGPEGTDAGPRALITGLPSMAFYYVMRFLPWSVASIAAALVLWRRTGDGGGGRWRGLGRPGAWLHGAALMVALVLTFYTFSAGKRPLYIAAALPAGALLAGWWLTTGGPAAVRRRAWLAPAAAATVLVIATVRHQGEAGAPAPAFGSTIRSFVVDAADAIAREPRPVTFLWAGRTQLQAMLGYSERDGAESVLGRVGLGEPFWALVGQPGPDPDWFPPWLAARHPEVTVDIVLESAVLPETSGWYKQVRLYRVTPAPASP